MISGNQSQRTEDNDEIYWCEEENCWKALTDVSEGSILH